MKRSRLDSSAARVIGIAEARRHLSRLLISRLLKLVERGVEIVITRRGKAVAHLVPVGTASRDRLADTVARLKAFRHGRQLGDLSAKAPIEEGRR
jgi:prevent-host-death family protein